MQCSLITLVRIISVISSVALIVFCALTIVALGGFNPLAIIMSCYYMYLYSFTLSKLFRWTYGDIFVGFLMGQTKFVPPKVNSWKRNL